MDVPQLGSSVLSATRLKRAVANHRYERYFFLLMSLLILGTVFLGFAKSYYLAGVFRAPLPSPILHVHGAAFSLWILFLFFQTFLVSAKRVDLHRRLGLAGFALACAMVLLGVAAATDLLRRDSSGPAANAAFDAQAFYAGTLGDMLIFSTLVFFAYRARFNPSTHKRLILIATITLMQAATARWPFLIIARTPHLADFFAYSFLLLLLVYDIWSIRRVHPTTLWAGAFLVVLQQVEPLLGRTSVWQGFAAWVLQHARSMHGS